MGWDGVGGAVAGLFSDVVGTGDGADEGSRWEVSSGSAEGGDAGDDQSPRGAGVGGDRGVVCAAVEGEPGGHRGGDLDRGRGDVDRGVSGGDEFGGGGAAAVDCECG